MKSVNNEVGDIKVECRKEKTEEKSVGNLFFEGDFFAEKIKRNKHKSEHSAVNVGDNRVTAASDCGHNRGKVICKKIENSVVVCKLFGHFA